MITLNKICNATTLKKNVQCRKQNNLYIYIYIYIYIYLLTKTAIIGHYTVFHGLISIFR